MRTLLSLTILIALWACRSTPPGPAAEEAAAIVAVIDAGNADSASARFERAKREQGYSDKLYPLFYDEALQRYQKSDGAGASRIMEFMAQHYPDGAAVREALLYALFLERAKQTTPDPKLTAKLEVALAAAREKPLSQGSVWRDLIQAQVAIDRDRLPEAKEAVARFLAAWDGKPDSLAVYVDDIVRYVSSH